MYSNTPLPLSRGDFIKSKQILRLCIQILRDAQDDNLC